MHLVIGTGQPANLDFTIVSGRVIPAGAQIYAIFSGENDFEQFDEHLFNAMTDQEYYSFRALAEEARQREARSWRAGNASSASSFFSKLRGWLLGLRIVAQTK